MTTSHISFKAEGVAWCGWTLCLVPAYCIGVEHTLVQRILPGFAVEVCVRDVNLIEFSL